MVRKSVKNSSKKVSIDEAIKANRTLDAINKVFRERIKCRTEEELAKTCLAVAEELTYSKFGWIGEINSMGRLDTIAMSDPGWDSCAMLNKENPDLICNMELRGIWSVVLKSGESHIMNKPYSHPESVGTPEGHPKLTCFLGVPLKDGDKTIGMISLANKKGGYNSDDKESVEALSVSIVEAMKSKRSEIIMANQAKEIQEMSTPVIKVWDGIVIAPLIGTMDSQRTHLFMENFLDSIVKNNAEIAIVDITGVPTIDTQTAQHLIESITASQLLGTKMILTGIRPSIAQTLVHLGIDLSDVLTMSSLSDGLKIAFNRIGLELVKKD